MNKSAIVFYAYKWFLSMVREPFIADIGIFIKMLLLRSNLCDVLAK